MAALHSSALHSVECMQKASGKLHLEPPRKVARFSTTLRQQSPHSFSSLSCSSRPSFLEGNVKMHASASSAASSSVEEAMEESEVGISYEKLQELLGAGEWELADEETRRLIIVLAGENAVKRKYVYFSEVQFMPKADLSTIDRLWRTHSNGKFGYSVQRKIMKRVDGDCTAFFKKVQWMKPLGSDTMQFTYCSFPTEFMWELGPNTPEGHLPLTNALRGTQLLKCLLDHPAFDFADDDLQVPLASSSAPPADNANRSPPQQQLPKKPLSINYSF